MPDLLLELYCEEIPARMQRQAADYLRRKMGDSLRQAGLAYEGAKTYWTPRRLVLDMRAVSDMSKGGREERKGPRQNAPPQAIDGFLRANNLDDIDQAELREDDKKGAYYVIVIEKEGRKAEDIIRESAIDLMNDFPWPKSMRWGAQSAQSGSFRWVRPLQSIACTLSHENGESQVIEFECGQCRSADAAYGHRFHAPEPFRFRGFEDYAAKLEKAHVILDAERRKNIIKTDGGNLAFAAGLEMVEDENLLEETANLTEWPVVLMGEFDPAFLELPARMIRLTIRENQKCFVMRKIGEKDLCNRFLMVANIEAVDGGKEIARGNGRVVNARLYDAKFFWESDLREIEQNGFDLWRKKLGRVTFHAELGTQLERVELLERLAEKLAPVTGADKAKVRRAARICKADLMSAVVGDFPALQGLMGRLYGERLGEDCGVSKACEDHYKPQGPKDEVPAEKVTVTIALADKIAVLCRFWEIGEKPTGSKDPFALRRAALGVIRLVLENGLRLDLRAFAHSQLKKKEVADDLFAFFLDRLKVHWREEGKAHDLIDAAMEAKDGDLWVLERRLRALSEFMEERGQNLLMAAKRVNHILAASSAEKISGASVKENLFEEKCEKTLLAALGKAEKKTDAAVKKQDFAEALRGLETLAEPLDVFFERVMVNAEKKAVRANRLALLKRIETTMERVADFSKIGARG